MCIRERADAFKRALGLVPFEVRPALEALGEEARAAAEEVRLRVGRPPAITLPDGERTAGERPVTARDLERVFELASRASVHSVGESLRHGFVTAPGGFRVGFCGTASVSEGGMTGFRALSSAAIRIPREVKGAADAVMRALFPDFRPLSLLIVSPPGGGKTTLLRDVVRQLSDGGVRVAVADERGEIAASASGIPQMDVGARTDVLDACPRGQAVMTLLRCMAPQMIAMDEITAPEDARALMSAASCGVRLIATAHADSAEDLRARPLYRALLDAGAFDAVVYIIRNPDGGRAFRCVRREEESA